MAINLNDSAGKYENWGVVGATPIAFLYEMRAKQSVATSLRFQ